MRTCGLADVSVEPIVIVDDASEGLEWVTFPHERADMAASAGVVTEAEAVSLREGIDRAVALRRDFSSLTQFVVWGDV